MKVEDICYLVFYAGHLIESSNVSLSGSHEYIASNEAFTLTCTSSLSPRGNTAYFFKDNYPVMNIIYSDSTSSCYGVPQDGRAPFICDNSCSCSSDNTMFTWAYSGLITNKSVLFICKMDLATNSVGLVSAELSVDKAHGPANVVLYPSLTVIAVNESDNMGPLQCISDCVPTCTLSWSGPGITGNTSVLIIKQTQRSNHGTYTCTAKNLFGTSAVDILIVVQFGPDSITLNPSGQSYVITETSSVGPVSCTSSCYPVCKMQWTGPGILDTESQLYLTNIKRHNAGNFTCTASNVVNSVKEYITISVEYGPSSVSLNPGPSSIIAVSVADQVGPLYCSSDCVPTCVYNWRGPNITTQTSALLITNIQRNNNGTYICTAMNSHGSRQVNLDIVVQFKPYLDLSKPNSPLQIGAMQDDKLLLISFVNAYPASIVHWTFKPEEDTTSCNATRLHSNTSTTGFSTSSFISIEYVHSSNFGEYTFTARNFIGDLVRTFVVREQGKPMPPVYLYVVCKSTTAVVIWKPGFHGGLSQDFYIQYSEIGKSMTSKRISDNETYHEFVYTVVGLHPDRKYMFSIHAVNLLGESSSQTADCLTDADLRIFVLFPKTRMCELPEL